MGLCRCARCCVVVELCCVFEPQRTWYRGAPGPLTTFSMRVDLPLVTQDVVRRLVWHPRRPLLFTSSDDGTVKTWNLASLSRAVARRSDIDPTRTFRGHTSEVLSLCVFTGEAAAAYVNAACDQGPSDVLLTGGADATVRVWRIPSESDPTSAYVLGGGSCCARTHTHTHTKVAVGGCSAETVGERRQHALRAVGSCNTQETYECSVIRFNLEAVRCCSPEAVSTMSVESNCVFRAATSVGDDAMDHCGCCSPSSGILKTTQIDEYTDYKQSSVQ